MTLNDVLKVLSEVEAQAITGSARTYNYVEVYRIRKALESYIAELEYKSWGNYAAN